MCESIADLADVTGVDKQMIIMKLLHNEHVVKLLTGSLYN